MKSNSILGNIHQLIVSLVNTFNLQKSYLDEDDPWSGILEATSFSVQSTYHTMLQAITGQLVFGCDMILNKPLSC